jgi:hypothetical protein
MCLGGPNHCRIGQAGSQTVLLLVDCCSLLPDAGCAS